MVQSPSQPRSFPTLLPKHNGHNFSEY
jgi:hypothetical protein